MKGLLSNMPNLLILVFIPFIFCACSSHKTTVSDASIPQEDVADDVTDVEAINRVLIVYYDAAVGKHYLVKQARKLKCSVVYDYRNFNAVALQVPAREDMGKIINQLRNTKGVLQVSRNRTYKLNIQ